eukprot:Selendium_serpulae@DN1439_c0_g1_i1.p1
MKKEEMGGDSCSGTLDFRLWKDFLSVESEDFCPSTQRQSICLSNDSLFVCRMTDSPSSSVRDVTLQRHTVGSSGADLASQSAKAFTGASSSSAIVEERTGNCFWRLCLTIL